MNTLFNDKISILASFKNKNFELRYMSNSFIKLKKILILCACSVFLLFLLFSLADYVAGGYTLFFKILTIRLISIAVMSLFYFIFGRFKSYRSCTLTITVQELFFIVSYFVIISQYHNMSFALKCMDMIIILTLYFFIPNNWLNSLIVSLALVITFAVYCKINSANFLEKSNFLAGGCYITIAFVINAFNSYRTHFYKRSQFYDNLMLKNLLNTDALTGACTRIKFDQELKEHIERTLNSNYIFSIAIFDIDNFKRINDTYGHLVGDEILSGIADIVDANKRPNDILTRWGGEEFIIVFPSTELSNAAKISERLRIKIAEAVFSIDESVTCSFGVTEYQSEDTEAALISRADKFLYDAKANGKNTIAYG